MSAMASLISRLTVRSCLPSSISLSAMTFPLQGFGGRVGNGASVSPAADLLGPGVIEVGLAHLAVALATAHQSLQFENVQRFSTLAGAFPSEFVRLRFSAVRSYFLT
jgi:hypothetical protein